MKAEANKSLVAFIIALVIGVGSGYFLGVSNTRLDFAANIESGVLEDVIDMATIERNAATVEVYPDGF